MIDENTLRQKYQSAKAEVKKILFSEEFGKKLGVIGESNDLSEEQISSIANEIIMVLLEINNKDILTKNIEKLDVEKSKADKIVEEINDLILKEVLQKSEPQTKPIDQPSPQTQPKEITPQDNVGIAPNGGGGVGGSFEQIILNQAKAMRPATAPNNLPVSDETKVIHDYKSGDDPYREPVA